MTLAIIDGDVLCYQACANRWEKTRRTEGTNQIIQLDSDGKRVPVEWTKEEDRAYLEASWNKLQKDLQKLLDEIYCKDFLMAVKGPNNYRNLMYPEYKLNRHADPTKQNVFVPVLRKLCVHEELAVESEGREADDLMRIWAEQAREAGDDYIICSIDKDLKCIPGKHYLMHHDKKHTINVSPEEALRHYYEQMLKGDSTDNIPGVPKVGDVKATKLLAPYSTEEEFQSQVIEQYLIAYGEDDWKDYLLSNAKMIHLQTKPNDYFSFDTWPLVRELTL